MFEIDRASSPGGGMGDGGDAGEPRDAGGRHDSGDGGDAGGGVPLVGLGDGSPIEPSLADRLDAALVRVDRWRDRPGVAAAGLVLALLMAAGGWWLGRPRPGPPLEDLVPMAEPIPNTAPGPSALPSTVPSIPAGSGGAGGGSGPTGPGAMGEVEVQDRPGPMMVHVAGEVVRPGVVAVEVGARVADAIDAAGGATEVGDVHLVNLATPVVDGMQIVVPGPDDDGGGPYLVGPGPGPERTDGSPARGGADRLAGAEPIDLNTADQLQLESLPGIGPTIATAIIGWRADNGRFRSVEDLLAVPGIGPAKLEAVRDLVVIT